MSHGCEINSLSAVAGWNWTRKAGLFMPLSKCSQWNSCVVGVCVFQEELEYVDRVYSLCFADVDDAYVAER